MDFEQWYEEVPKRKLYARSDKRWLFDCPTVKEWLRRLHRTKGYRRETWRNAITSLWLFCRHYGKKPDEIVEDAKRDPAAMKEAIEDWPESNLNLARSSFKTWTAYVKSFLMNNGVNIGRLAVCGDLSGFEDRAATLEDIELMMDASEGIRDKFSIMLSATTGLSPESISCVEIKDTMIVEYGGLEYMVIEVHGRKNRNEIKYRVVASPTAVHFYKLFTMQRKDIKEGFLMGGVTSKSIREDITRGIKKAGLVETIGDKRRWRLHPYSLRKFFETELSKTMMKTEVREFMAGHKLKFQGNAYMRYTAEFLVEEYAKHATRALDYKLAKRVRSPKEELLGFVRARAKELGIDLEELFKGPVERIAMTAEQEYALLEKAIHDKELDARLSKEAIVEEAVKRLTSGELTAVRVGKQRIIEEEELEKALDDGWKVMAVLRSGKVVVER